MATVNVRYIVNDVEAAIEFYPICSLRSPSQLQAYMASTRYLQHLVFKPLGRKGITMTRDALPTLEFEHAYALRMWLEKHHNDSDGIWIRIFKKNSGIPSVTFEEVLDEGLCFGWSESVRRGYDQVSYLQKFTPRKSRGTKSARNLARARALIEQGEMQPAGLKALGIG
jgi:hypothetical protein